MDDKLILIVPFFFGVVIGSFLNVCIHRLPLGASIVSPPSSCPGCGKPIPFYLNIPVLSYIILFGRCANCKTPISPVYPAVEAATGLFAAALFYRYGLSAEMIVYFAFISSLIVITFIDLRHQIIPDVISLPGIAAGFLASFFMPEPGILNSAIGLVAGGGILFAVAAGYYMLTGSEGMGGGDIKLLAMIGAFLGWKGVIMTLLAGSFAGALVGVFAMTVYGKGGKHAIPFGPFLAFGAVLNLFFGEAILRWYIERAIGA